MTNNDFTNKISPFVISPGRGDDIDAEAGARLTCHLLLRLFKTSEVPQPAMYSVGKHFVIFVLLISVGR